MSVWSITRISSAYNHHVTDAAEEILNNMPILSTSIPLMSSSSQLDYQEEAVNNREPTPTRRKGKKAKICAVSADVQQRIPTYELCTCNVCQRMFTHV